MNGSEPKSTRRDSDAIVRAQESGVQSDAPKATFRLLIDGVQYKALWVRDAKSVRGDKCQFCDLCKRCVEDGLWMPSWVWCDDSVTGGYIFKRDDGKPAQGQQDERDPADNLLRECAERGYQDSQTGVPPAESGRDRFYRRYGKGAKPFANRSHGKNQQVSASHPRSQRPSGIQGEVRETAHDTVQDRRESV